MGEGIKKLREKYCSNQKLTRVIKLEKNILELISSNCGEDDFL